MRSTVLLFPLLLLVNGGGSELEPGVVTSSAAEGWMGLVPLPDTDLFGPQPPRPPLVVDSLHPRRDQRPVCPMPVVRPPERLLVQVPRLPLAPRPPRPEPRVTLVAPGSAPAGLAVMPTVPSGCVNPLFRSADTTH